MCRYTTMKKNSVIYSVNQFKSAASSIVVEDCLWIVDGIYPTKVGEFSKTPLFELQLKQLDNSDDDIPEGFRSGTQLLRRNRSYFVREDRPLYTELAELWIALDGNSSEFMNVARDDYSKMVFKGHVERLSGITFTKTSRNGTIVQSNRAEFWYPVDYEPGTAINDFVYLCNRGVYTPMIEEAKPDPVADAISKLDPEVIARIIAANK